MFDSQTIVFLALMSFVLQLVIIAVIGSLIYNRYIAIQEYEFLYRSLNTAIKYAYAVIYKNHILTIKLNNTTLSNNEINQLRKMFLDFVKDTVGPKIWKKLVGIHGSEKSVELMLLLMFDEMLDEDLAKQS